MGRTGLVAAPRVHFHFLPLAGSSGAACGSLSCHWKASELDRCHLIFSAAIVSAIGFDSVLECGVWNVPILLKVSATVICRTGSSQETNAHFYVDP